MSYHILSVLAGLLATSTPNTPVSGMAHYNDGSVVRVTMRDSHLKVSTKYGLLTIPMSDIRQIDFGWHVATELEKDIHASIKQLGSDAYKQREDAKQHLTGAGLTAYPILMKTIPHSDLEVSQRIAQLLKGLADKHPPEELSRPDKDVIRAAAFDVTGRIQATGLHAYSESFGEVTLALPKLRKLCLLAAGDSVELVVDAAKYGSAADQWLDAGTVVGSNLRLIVRSEGQVDLWPQGPGQYMTGPKGYSTAGKDSTFMAGTLLGRIGTSGKAFVVGEQFDGIPTHEGRLFLHIVPSPWNNASTGTYRVRIRTDFAATAR